MVSIKEIKAKLEVDGRAYTDEEVMEVREILYKLARLDYELFKETLKKEKQANSSTEPSTN